MNKKSPTDWILLLCLCGLAALLQFWGLDAQSLWYDEGFSVWLSQQSVAEMIAITAADIQPPFYYLLLHGWIRLTGTSEWTLRFLSAFFAVLAVPLMWQVAYRTLRQRSAAHVAAWWVTISPLWLWYGREVRNYALGLALLLAAAYCFVPLLRRKHQKYRSLFDNHSLQYALAFGLLMTLGLYTHYFMLFVLVAWGLTALLWWIQMPQRATFWPLVVGFGLPVLLLLPWLGIIVRRLEEDKSYWEGELSLWEVIEKTWASWMVGHSAHEGIALWLGDLGLLLAGVGLLLLFLNRSRDDSSTKTTKAVTTRTYQTSLPAQNWLFIAFWLLIPFVAFLLVAWNRPKFNPRYLMFAAPAFLLSLSGLIAWLWARKWAARMMAIALVLSLSSIFAWADWNLFNDYAFAKANWRGVTDYLAEHRRADEPILLVSGHTYPIFHYYYPEQEHVFRLPDERTLDTTAVLGLERADFLSEALQESEQVWVVKWQDRVVDPDEVISALLTASGAEEKETPFFMEVELERWALPPQADFEAALQPTHAQEVRFGDALRLLGWSDLPIAPSADDGLSLVLYWSAQRELEGDYKARLTVIDEAGFEYGLFDQRPTSYYYPTFRWQAGNVRLATLNIELQTGTPAGEYWIDLSVYREKEGINLDMLNDVGAPIGKVTRLGPFAVAPAENGWLTEPLPKEAQSIGQTLLDEQHLLGVQLPDVREVEPSQRLPFTFWWQTSGPLPGATLHIGWQQGTTILESTPQPLANATWTGEKWRTDDLLMTPFMLRVPRHLEPGNSDVLGWMSDGQGRQSEPITLTSVEIVATEYIFDAPTVPIAQEATFGDAIRLLGYELTPQSADSPPQLTLYWQGLTEMPQSLTVFAHLLDANGLIVPDGGQDKLPLDGTRPTDTWVAGEYLSDTFTLRPPAARTTAPYTIEIGWDNAQDATFPRLPAQGEGADEAQRRVLLRASVE